MRHPNPDILLRIAQGDAFGMATEFITLPDHRETYDAALRIEAYCQHPTHHEVPAGHYTDDTQMSIAVSEVLLGGDDDRPSAARFAEAFVACFKRDPRKGYARG